jgi:hypothetical protein
MLDIQGNSLSSTLQLYFFELQSARIIYQNGFVFAVKNKHASSGNRISPARNPLAKVPKISCTATGDHRSIDRTNDGF